MSLAVKKSQVRLVFLGAAGVGKTSLIRRFLQNTFEPKHRRTVEELHSKEYEVSGITIKVEILDTSGSYSFPAMRKLSIQNSDAFALVYAVDDAESFERVKTLHEEILELKEDKSPPIVVVGNKAETGGARQVLPEDVLSLVELDWNNRFLEASAKENENVMEVFRELLQQVNLPSLLSPVVRRRRQQIDLCWNSDVSSILDGFPAEKIPWEQSIQRRWASDNPAVIEYRMFNKVRIR
ncbi:hypothetical protein E2320_015760 [Naja naja]|nr:hypothetical protein E2320_015760 [Naja naja]